MNKQTIYIIGALAAILGVFLISRKRDSIVQVPQIGQVGTAPGPDTTGVELGFKSNVFTTYADLLKTQAALDARTSQLATQAGVESQRLATSLEIAKVSDKGQTDRASIWANSSNFAAAQAYDAQRRAQNAQNTANILRALTSALGSLGRGSSSGGSSGGSTSSGGSSGGMRPPTRPGYPSRNPVFNIPVNLPGGYNGPTFPEGYTPPFVDYGDMFGGYDPFGGGDWFDYPSPDYVNTFPDFGNSGWFGWNPTEVTDIFFPAGYDENPYPEYGDWGFNFGPDGDWIGG